MVPKGAGTAGGKNPFGEPNLALRWGVTYTDPMSTAPNTIKYLDFNQGGKQFGERRWIVEIWRSPEFLIRSGRYQVTTDSDTVTERYFCKACETEIKCDERTLEIIGSVPPCPQCGSKRSRTETIRDMGEGRILCDFPSEGCYDYWLRIETSKLTYHAPDNEALKVCQALWEWEQLTEGERDALAQGDYEVERRQMIAQQRSGTIYTGAVHPLYIPS